MHSIYSKSLLKATHGVFLAELTCCIVCFVRVRCCIRDIVRRAIFSGSVIVHVEMCVKLLTFHIGFTMRWLEVIIPPAYKVYRGYIVFAFSVYMFACLLTFFLSKISRKLLDLGF